MPSLVPSPATGGNAVCKPAEAGMFCGDSGAGEVRCDDGSGLENGIASIDGSDAEALSGGDGLSAATTVAVGYLAGVGNATSCLPLEIVANRKFLVLQLLGRSFCAGDEIGRE